MLHNVIFELRSFWRRPSSTCLNRETVVLKICVRVRPASRSGIHTSGRDHSLPTRCASGGPRRKFGEGGWAASFPACTVSVQTRTIFLGWGVGGGSCFAFVLLWDCCNVSGDHTCSLLDLQLILCTSCRGRTNLARYDCMQNGPSTPPPPPAASPRNRVGCRPFCLLSPRSSHSAGPSCRCQCCHCRGAVGQGCARAGEAPLHGGVCRHLRSCRRVDPGRGDAGWSISRW